MKLTNIPGVIPKIAILAADLIFSVGAFGLALLFTLDLDLGAALSVLFSPVTLVLLGLRFIAFFYFRTPFIILRYIGEHDYRSIVLAVAVSSAVFLMVGVLWPDLFAPANAPATVFVEGAFSLLACLGLRIFFRLRIDQRKVKKRSRINTAIFGAGELGNQTLRVLRGNSEDHNYHVVAFFDDNVKVHNKRLNGVKVFDPERSFRNVIQKYDIKTAIIGINELPDERRLRFINHCLDQKVKVLKIPPTGAWINGHLNVSQLRDINFEDLLNRSPIRLDEEKVKASVNGKVVFVTGCAGSIGSEIVRQLLRYGPRRVIGVDIAETPMAAVSLELKKFVEEQVFETIIADVRDYDKMERLFKKYRPEYVFHAAAYKHVPIMETFPEEAVKANVLGTRNLADLSADHEVEKFVMISTDKVVNPSNVMGATKRIAEMYVQSLNKLPKNRTEFITTRFGNVLGSNGSVIPIFKEQIEKRQPVTVTHPDVQRYFMTIPEACQLVLEAGAIGNGGEIYVFDMGRPVRIVALAHKMIKLAGLTPQVDIKIEFTGLRPGEKLSEELFDGQENLKETHHPKIKIADVRRCEYHQIKSSIDLLIDHALQGLPKNTLVGHMKELVPEFTSQNSEFSKLDKR